MARYGAEQIYAFAREAGFSPDQAVTMTAVALAESGGNSGAHNPHGEDSRGLWQINVQAHGDMGNLYDPLTNAKAAFEVSRQGGDISPWTVTHGGMGARYLRYRSEAEAAAMAYGDGDVEGNWSGSDGYGDRTSAGDSSGQHTGREPGDSGDATVVQTGGGTAPGGMAADGGAEFGLELETPQAPGGIQPVSNTTSTAPEEDYGLALETPGVPLEPAPDGGTTPVNATGDGTALQTFLNSALDQTGDQYVFGAEVEMDNPNPSRFDCSELVEWASHQAGIEMPDGAVFQYRHLHQAGTQMSVEQAIDTPGALLFSFSSDPLTGRPGAAHVAISLGNGKTIEAMGDAYGVTEGNATTSRFTYAAYIPELGTGGLPAGPPPEASGPGDDFADRMNNDPAEMDNDERTVQASERLTDAKREEPAETARERAERDPDGDIDDDGVANEDDAEIDDVDVDQVDAALAGAEEWAQGGVEVVDAFGSGLADDTTGTT